MNIVLFSQEEISTPLKIKDPRAQHILNVLHKRQGDYFESGVINGKAGTALITAVTKDSICFEFTAQTDGKPLYPLVLIIGFPRPIQLKRLLRDVASLGVGQVHLCVTELGEKSYLKSTLAQPNMAYEMLKDGSVQAKSTHVPDLFFHKSLTECLDCKEITGKRQAVRIALDNVHPECSLLSHEGLKSNNVDLLQKNGVLAAVGSERGWTDNERNLLKENEFTLCGMGSRVLRTETACTAAAALILSKMGAM